MLLLSLNLKNQQFSLGLAPKQEGKYKRIAQLSRKRSRQIRDLTDIYNKLITEPAHNIIFNENKFYINQ